MDEKIKKNILITGASSFIGEGLARRLQDSSNLFLLTHNKKILTKNTNTVFVHGDIRDVKQWSKKLPHIDVVIHLAAITHTTDTSLYNKVNNLGTQTLVEVFKDKNLSHFIFISTRAIGSCCGEYGASKEAAEKFFVDSGLNYTIIRPGEVYNSNFKHKEGLGSLAKLIKNSPIVPYLYSQKYKLSPVHTDDVLSSIINTIENKSLYGKTLLVTGPDNLSLKEVVKKISTYFKKRRILIPVPVFFVKCIFWVLVNIFQKGAPDQVKRFLCTKESMSEKMKEELDVIPRKFLPLS